MAEFVRHRRHSYRFNANQKVNTLSVENAFGTAPTPWLRGKSLIAKSTFDL